MSATTFLAILAVIAAIYFLAYCLCKAAANGDRQMEREHDEGEK